MRASQVSGWILAGLLLFASACTGNNPVEDQGFVDRAHILVRYVAAADLRTASDGIFPQGYTLEETPRPPLTCHDGGTLNVITFIVHGTDPQKIDVYFDLMLEFWSMSGWNLINNNRPDAMFMNASKNDYNMSIRAGIHGQVSISNITPCI